MFKTEQIYKKIPLQPTVFYFLAEENANKKATLKIAFAFFISHQQAGLQHTSAIFSRYLKIAYKKSRYIVSTFLYINNKPN